MGAFYMHPSRIVSSVFMLISSCLKMYEKIGPFYVAEVTGRTATALDLDGERELVFIRNLWFWVVSGLIVIWQVTTRYCYVMPLGNRGEMLKAKLAGCEKARLERIEKDLIAKLEKLKEKNATGKKDNSGETGETVKNPKDE